MALTPNHKIYSPDPRDRAQARTQMSTMASSMESALNAQTASVQQSLARTAATLNADSQGVVVFDAALYTRRLSSGEVTTVRKNLETAWA